MSASESPLGSVPPAPAPAPALARRAPRRLTFGEPAGSAPSLQAAQARAPLPVAEAARPRVWRKPTRAAAQSLAADERPVCPPGSGPGASPALLGSPVSPPSSEPPPSAGSAPDPKIRAGLRAPAAFQSLAGHQASVALQSPAGLHVPAGPGMPIDPREYAEEGGSPLARLRPARRIGWWLAGALALLIVVAALTLAVVLLQRGWAPTSLAGEVASRLSTWVVLKTIPERSMERPVPAAAHEHAVPPIDPAGNASPGVPPDAMAANVPDGARDMVARLAPRAPLPGAASDPVPEPGPQPASEPAPAGPVDAGLDSAVRSPEASGPSPAQPNPPAEAAAASASAPTAAGTSAARSPVADDSVVGTVASTASAASVASARDGRDERHVRRSTPAASSGPAARWRVVSGPGPRAEGRCQGTRGLALAQCRQCTGMGVIERGFCQQRVQLSYCSGRYGLVSDCPLPSVVTPN